MSHASHSRAPFHAPGRRLTLLLLIPAALLPATGMVLLWPHNTPDPVAPADGPVRVLGEVLAVTRPGREGVSGV